MNVPRGRLSLPSVATFTFVAVALSLASPAAACPACATREGSGIGGLLSMGVMIALPFAIVALVVPAIRRASAPSNSP